MNEQKPNIDALMSEAFALHAKGAIGRAEEIYRAILKQQRNHPMALHMLGVMHFQRGDTELGIRFVQRALTVQPDFPDALTSLAGFHLHSGDPGEAMAVVQRALSAHGDFMAGLQTLAKAQLRLKDYSGVLATFKRLDALSPDHPGTLADWAATLLRLGRFAEAEQKYAALILLEPKNRDVRCFHAQTLKGLGRFDEALKELDEILSEYPDYLPALVHAGDALQALGDTPGAIARFRMAISIQPDHAEAHFNLGVSLLTMGNYHEGWSEYAWRFRMEAYANFMPPAAAPIWAGEPLDGKSILIFAEQGLGDTLQFARYATPLMQRGATVSCQCSSQVLEIVASIDGVDEMYAFDHVVPKVDYQISMMELPRVFNTDRETVPGQAGYLHAPKNIFPMPRKPAVGIVWQGNTAHKNDAYRSLPLACFDGVLGMGEGDFYSLQVGEATAQITALGWQDRLEDLSPRLQSFSDTADVISKLDLVITVDTSVAHLAGGLGVPVWVLLPTIADWRWGREATTSCWYRSMRLFRQRRLGHWDSVFGDVEVALAEFFASL